MTNPTLLIRLSWNPKGWTAGVRHDKAEGGWPELHSWAGEDWNFAMDQAVAGTVYGFSQAVPGKEAIAANRTGRWDIVFFTRDPAGRSGVIGMYRDAVLLPPESTERDDAWAEMAKIAERRAKQLEVAFGDGTELGKAKRKRYLKERAVSWKVAVGNVVNIPGFPGLPEPFDDWRRFHRFQNAYAVGSTIDAFLDKLIHEDDPELIASGFLTPSGKPTEVWEGRQCQRKHLTRERNVTLVAKFRASRLIKSPIPHFKCDACEATLVKEHAGFAEHGFDVHHQVPLHTLSGDGGKTNEKDLCILCVRCHRLAHASGYFAVSVLREILKSPEGLAGGKA